MNINFHFDSIIFALVLCTENLFLHRIRAGHNCVSLNVCLFLRRARRKRRNMKSECSGKQQEDIEEMAQSEEMRKHKLLYNNKFIHNLSQHEM